MVVLTLVVTARLVQAREQELAFRLAAELVSLA